MPMDSRSCALLTTMDCVLMAAAVGTVAISSMVLALQKTTKKRSHTRAHTRKAYAAAPPVHSMDVHARTQAPEHHGHATSC
jgi:hypothetical protein